MKIVAKGSVYDLAATSYDVICEIDKFVMPKNLVRKQVVVRQLCVTNDGRFFILTIADYDLGDREKVQVWPVEKGEASMIAEGFVEADRHEKYFGR